jgi:hypothetical protein
MEGNAPAQIAEGVTRGAPVADIGEALAAQIKAQEATPEAIKATVAGAIAGAVAEGKLASLSAITFAAAATPALRQDVLDQTIVSAPPALQYAGVLGVLAAAAEQAPALLQRALASRDLAPGQAEPITAGGGLIVDIQTVPTFFLRAAAQRLRERRAVPVVESMLLGASLANPRGTPAVAALAAALTDLPPENLVTAASRGNPHLRRRITPAVETARHFKADASGLFREVAYQVAIFPDFAPEFVAGALAAVPECGHVTGHAAVRAAPVAAGRIIPWLFAFAAEDSTGETFVTLTSGVMHGVLAADLDPASESRAVTEVVALAVKSVIGLARARGAAAATAWPAGDTVAAVIAAAVRADPARALEIAQVAARTVRALSFPSEDTAWIVAAVRAAGASQEAAKIADAVASGVVEADRQVPAANLKVLLDYTQDGLTGRPMTHFRDL